MPIKPENKARYPANWRAIVAQVRERAGNRCEGSPAHPDCNRTNGWLLNKRTGEMTNDGALAEVWQLADGDKVTRIVCTTGHLNHQPEDCALDNLRYWCQRCHLAYDQAHHMATARATRRARAGTAELF